MSSTSENFLKPIVVHGVFDKQNPAEFSKEGFSASIER